MKKEKILLLYYFISLCKYRFWGQCKLKISMLKITASMRKRIAGSKSTCCNTCMVQFDRPGVGLAVAPLFLASYTYTHVN